ncbi:MAG: hypothetical protein ACLP1D_04935 [Xanthobacteraceae bacterium]
MRTILIATLAALCVVAAAAEALAQSSRSCTTTCSNSPSSGRTCTKTCN